MKNKTIIDPYTGKVVDAKLYKEGQLRGKIMRRNFNCALKEANRRGVPLSEIIPVN